MYFPVMRFYYAVQGNENFKKSRYARRNSKYGNSESYKVDLLVFHSFLRILSLHVLECKKGSS